MNGVQRQSRLGLIKGFIQQGETQRNDGSQANSVI